MNNLEEVRKKLIEIGFYGADKMSDRELERYSRALGEVSMPASREPGPLLGGMEASGTGVDISGSETQPPETKVPETSGEPGSWETAMMSVAKTVPSIIQLMRDRRPHAPAANVSGRRAFDIPTAGGVYGKHEGGFQSLLARLLAGR